MTANKSLKVSFLLLFVLYSYDAISHGIFIINADKSEFLNIQKSTIDVQVNNQIAIVTTTQIFINNSEDTLSGKYAFPLPQNANPLRLRWRSTKNWSEANIASNLQNTNLPGNSNNNPGSLSNFAKTYLGDSPLYYKINDKVAPGKTISVELEYAILLSYSYGEVSFEYPNDYSSISAYPFEEQEFNFELISERSIESIHIDYFNSSVESSNNQATISHNIRQKNPSQNYKIVYTLSSEELGTNVMSTSVDYLPKCSDSPMHGFTTMIIEPESNDDTKVIQKNFTLVIDKSGSMDGIKFTQAKEAARFIINNLNDGDNFNIISFNGFISSFRNLHVPINNKTRNEALEYIDDLRAINATDIGAALEEAVRQFTNISKDKANIVIFFTDGVATTGILDREEILDHIRFEIQKRQTNIFLYTLGIGEDVDKGLLTLLARENNGLVDFLEDKDVEEKITSMFLRINNPILINTEITFEPPNVVQQIYPYPIPNLYKGEQLIISGRYHEAQDVNMIISGQAFNLPVTYTVPISLSDTSVAKHSFLPKIWAKQTIDDLSLDYNIAEAENVKKQIQNRIDDLSICFGVVTLQFNSFAEEEVLEFNLMNFTTRVNEDNSILLEWITTMEVNNDRFEIERSINLEDWSSIGSVKGNGSTAETNYYSFEDAQPFSGLNYYRLKQINFNGEVYYSPLRIAIVNDKYYYTIYPNPAQSNNKLFLQWDQGDNLTVEIFNIVGQKVYSLSNFKSNELHLPQLPKGQYILNLIREQNTTSIRLNLE